MNLGKIILAFLCLVIGFTACKKDEADDFIPVELRDRTEQQISDNDSIVKYLKSHYYNASTFAGNSNASIADLIITKVDGAIPDPDNNKLLFGSASLDSIQVIYTDTDYNIYFLKLKVGGGESPTFADNVRVNYNGFTLDNAIFDSSANPTDFDLLNLIPGWRKVMPLFKTATSFVENGDGTVTYSNHGVGAMFIPSGLAYFANSSTGIPSYSPIIFKFDLLDYSVNDHDFDGVPSWKEDLPLTPGGEGNGDFYTSEGIADDDTDGDGIPNYLDNDDDGDGIPTIREDINKNGDPTDDDSNMNGIPNYLDKTDTKAN